AAKLPVVNLESSMLVAGHDALAGLVQHVGGLAQLFASSGHPSPGVVDHHQCVVCHLNTMGTAGGYASSTPARSVNARGAALAEAAKRVVDRDTVKQVATDGVEPHQYRGYTVILLLQVANEVTGGNPPEPDLAVDEHLDDLALLLPGCADAVPVFSLQLRHPGSFVEYAPR